MKCLILISLIGLIITSCTINSIRTFTHTPEKDIIESFPFPMKYEDHLHDLNLPEKKVHYA